ncbi:hypothetical protein GCM10027317_09980 [Massilia agri]
MHVHGAAHTLAQAQLDEGMRNPRLPGESLVGGVSVRHQKDVRVEHRKQMPVQLPGGDGSPAGDEGARLAAAVACDEDAIVFTRNSPTVCDPAAFAGGPVQLA